MIKLKSIQKNAIRQPYIAVSKNKRASPYIKENNNANQVNKDHWNLPRNFDIKNLAKRNTFLTETTDIPFFQQVYS